MSFWRKLLGLSGDGEGLSDADGSSDMLPRGPVPSPAPDSPPRSDHSETVEDWIAAGHVERAIQAFEDRLGQTAEPDSEAIMGLAKLMMARGALREGWSWLRPRAWAPEPAPELIGLAAEFAERMGHQQEAADLYERLLARSIRAPGVRAHWERLRGSKQVRLTPAASTLALPGDHKEIERFRVVEGLGRGGAGSVFLAEDQPLARRVALKVYHRQGSAKKDQLLREARIPAKFEHPGIIRILDANGDSGWIAMEWHRQGSIRQAITGVAPGFERALGWIVQAVDAVIAVHQAGMVHRDLKPSNFLLGGDRVTLTDFGLAIPVGEVPIPVAGQRPGTLAYLAPEQGVRSPATFAEDMFALGATMREILQAVSGEDAIRWFALADRCMDPDPTRRPSAQELRTALRRRNHPSP